MGAFHSYKLSRQKYPNFLDPFLGKDLSRAWPFREFRKFCVEWEAPILQFV